MGANTCQCPNGVAATGSACMANNAVMCPSCNAGNHLHHQMCHLNQCFCPNGSPATGIQCVHTGDTICTACDIGFHVDHGVCHENECVCPLGWPKRISANGHICQNDGAEE